MSESQSRMNWGLCILGFFLCLGFVLSSLILTRAVKEIKTQGQIIEVTGFAERKVTSDLAIWSCSFGATEMELEKANAKVDEIRKKVTDYLTRQGAKAENMEIKPPAIHESMKQQEVNGKVSQVFAGWQVDQVVKFTSTNVEQVENASLKISELFALGLAIEAAPPVFYYTKLDDMKMAMLEEASANARLRAQKLAGKNESNVGALRYIHQGVFQITPPYSNEVSDNGVNDVTSKHKIFKAIVTAHYAVNN